MKNLRDLLSSTNNLLLVEDSPDDRSDLKLTLESMGLQVFESPSSVDAKESFLENAFSLVIIHLASDQLASLALCRWIRAASNVPILMLTGRNELVDEVMIIKAGADDYVSMPIDVKILASRISQQLKRGQSKLIHIDQNLVWGSMEMDLNQHTFTIENNSVKLTNSEFQFLQLLMENPQRIFSRVEILGALGVLKGIGTDHIVDAHASRIRSKIRENGGPEVISVIRSVGFRLTDQQLLGV
jgi:DNA-binding response OmpR family regulator